MIKPGTLNRYIRLVREHKEMSQSELAASIGETWTHSRVADLERGASSPTGTTISRIAAAMGMTDHQFYRLGSELAERQ